MTDIELTATRHHDDHGTDEDYDESESLLVVTKGEDEHDYIDDDDPGHVSTNQTSGRTRYLHLFWNSPWLPSGPWCLPTCSCCCRRHRRHRLSTKNNINDNNNDNNQQGYGDDDDDDGDDNGGSDEQLVHTAVILDAAAVQLFKFFIVTIGLMCLVHYYAEVTVRGEKKKGKVENKRKHVLCCVAFLPSGGGGDCFYFCFYFVRTVCRFCLYIDTCVFVFLF